MSHLSHEAYGLKAASGMPRSVIDELVEILRLRELIALATPKMTKLMGKAKASAFF